MKTKPLVLLVVLSMATIVLPQAFAQSASDSYDTTGASGTEDGYECYEDSCHDDDYDGDCEYDNYCSDGGAGNGP